MRCPKCKHCPTFGEAIGECETCGRKDWELWKGKDGTRLVLCKHCEVGPSEIRCNKCDSIIQGTWIERDWVDWAPIEEVADAISDGKHSGYWGCLVIVIFVIVLFIIYGF